MVRFPGSQGLDVGGFDIYVCLFSVIHGIHVVSYYLLLKRIIILLVFSK